MSDGASVQPRCGVGAVPAVPARDPPHRVRFFALCGSGILLYSGSRRYRSGGGGVGAARRAPPRQRAGRRRRRAAPVEEDGEVVHGLAVCGLHGDLLDLVDVRRAELERERRRVRAALARGPGAVGRRLEVDVEPAREALGPRAAALAEHHEGDVEAVREASMPSVVSQTVGASAQPSTPISWA